MCLVNDNETFRANKHFVSLELAARAQAGLTIRGGEVVEGAGVVRVEAGAWLDLLCHGYEGVPAPSFTWRGPARASGSSLLIQQVSHELTRSWPPEVTRGHASTAAERRGAEQHEPRLLGQLGGALQGGAGRHQPEPQLHRHAGGRGREVGGAGGRGRGD